MKWDRPPEIKSREQWAEIREKLQANPGEWALVSQAYGNNMPHGLRRSGIQVQSKILSYSPRKFMLWARYVPEKVTERAALGPTSSEAKKNRIEDIEDLIRFGATFDEIVSRSYYASWHTMRRALKNAGRYDLINILNQKRAS